MPVFLHFKQCVAISNFGSTVLCGFAKQTRLMKNKPKPLFNVLTYWTTWNVLASTAASLPDDPLAFKTKCCIGKYLFVYHKREAGWCSKPYSSLRLGHQTSDQVHSHFTMCMFIYIRTYSVYVQKYICDFHSIVMIRAVNRNRITD